MELDGKGGLALPFPSNRNKTFRASEEVPLILDKTTANTVNGVQIQSNTTELIHAENLFDAGGKIRLKIDDSGAMTLINGTNLTFKNVLVACGTERDRYAKPNQPKEKSNSNSNSERADSTGKETVKLERTRRAPTAKLATVESIPPNSQITITFGDSQQVIDDYRRLPLMANARRVAEQIWADKFGDDQSVPVEWLADLPELKAKWRQYSNRFLLRLNENNEAEVSRSVFVAAYEQFNPSNAVSLGKMFDCVFENLSLDVNEYRMFASTDEKLGQTKIDPSSTQTDRQTLVVAHLSHPTLPKIIRDKNSAADFKVASNSNNEEEPLEMFE